MAFLDHTAALGGAELSLLNLVGALDHGRWCLKVILGAEGPLFRHLTASDVAVETLMMPAPLTETRQERIAATTMASPARMAHAALYVNRLAQRLRRNRISLVHANSLRMCILGGLAARLAGIPCVWQIHSVVAKPMVSSSGVRVMQQMARLLPRHIVFNSDASAACFDVGRDAATVVPCGLDVFRFRPNATTCPGNRRIGMVARFAPIKGQHIFLEAAEALCSKYASVDFVLAGAAIFGEDVYEAGVRHRALRGRAAGHVQFLGFVDDVPKLLQSLTLLVHPSVEPEGFGRIIVEAMLSGKPVVASAAGGSAELIEDGVTGRLVPPGDARAMAEAIDELLKDPARAAQMGMRGRERAIELYDIRKTARAIEEVYEKVLART